MSEKIKSYIVIILSSGLFGYITGMNRDAVVNQLVRKEIIPMLAVNNYVMNVSTAYQAFKKEASLPYISLEKNRKMLRELIKKTNHFNRLGIAKNMPVYTFNVSDIRNRMLHKARNFYSRVIEITYYADHRNNIIPCMKIQTILQRVSLSGWEYKYFTPTQHVKKNGDAVQKNVLGCLPPQGKSLMIELFSDGNLSDWIKITNLIKPVQSVQSHTIIAPPCNILLPLDDSLFNEQDMDYRSINNTVNFYFFICTLMFMMTASFFG